MSKVLCVTVQFLDPEPSFHGRADGGEPEWPPSPLRLFQALTDAAASRWRMRQFDDYAKPVLSWLEGLAAPTIIAPPRHVGVPVRIAVPNNDLDVWAGPVSKGLAPKKQQNELKTMKTVRPTHILGGNVVHYLLDVPDSVAGDEIVLRLQAISRSITHLGWGVDMVAGNAAVISEEEVRQLKGERWRPAKDEAVTRLRVPKKGTLQALMEKHAAFLSRLQNDGFRPVPPLTCFDSVSYRRECDPQPRLFEVFSILKPDAEGFRAYDPVRRTHIVAGMVRHATANAAKASGWKTEKINTFVHGHTADGSQKGRSENGMARFFYVPLPTIGTKGGGQFDVVDSIRRVLIFGSGNAASELTWVRRALSGQELIDEASRQAVALLSLLPKTDLHVRKYTDSKSGWDTVSPVILPGHDDCDSNKTEKLLRQAIRQAGFSDTLAKFAILEWRKVGFRRVDLAQRYVTPAHLIKYPRYHVRIEWRDGTGKPVNVRGPIVIGGGRFCGFGLFAPTDA